MAFYAVWMPGIREDDWHGPFETEDDADRFIANYLCCKYCWEEAAEDGEHWSFRLASACAANYWVCYRPDEVDEIHDTWG